MFMYIPRARAATRRRAGTGYVYTFVRTRDDSAPVATVEEECAKEEPNWRNEKRHAKYGPSSREAHGTPGRGHVAQTPREGPLAPLKEGVA